MKMNNGLKEELGEFGSYLGWICVDPSNECLNLTAFLFFGQLVPWFSFFYMACNSCDAELSRPFIVIIELSLTILTCFSYFSISDWLKCDLFLLDNPVDVFRQKCVQDIIKKSLKIRLPCYVLIFFVAKCAYKIWCYAAGPSENPFLGNIVACSLELSSWLYRTTIFFFACIVLGHVHNFQKLQTEEFNKFFSKANSDLNRMLEEYLRIFEDMCSINNCFSPFFGLSLTLITLFQVAAVVQVQLASDRLRSHHKSTIFIQTDLVLWSMTVVAGLKIILNSAIEMSIVMKGITSAASRWHATQTINIANGLMSFQERKTLVKCLVQNPCDIVISGVKVEEFWLRLIKWTVPALTSVLTFYLLCGLIFIR